MNEVRCPYCGGKCECEKIDVGVGEVQGGPYCCNVCFSFQIHPDDTMSGTDVTDEERRIGWVKGGKSYDRSEPVVQPGQNA